MKRVLKWIGTGLVAVAVLALIIGFVLYSKASGALERTYEVSGVIESVPDDSATLARGEHLATTLVCRDCHGDDLSGRVMIDAPPFLVAPSNLTSGEGGVGGKLSVADFDRAIRYGVKPTGRPLFPMMPSNYYHKLSDEDAAALIAYLKSLPPVDNVVPQSQLRLLGNMIVGAGGIDFAHVVSTEPYGAVTPPLDSSADYGRYFSNVICSACHGDDLKGGEVLEPGTPAPPDISAIGAWPLDMFDKAVRGGVGAAGNELNPMMPSRHFAKLTDDEIVALHEYFKTL